MAMTVGMLKGVSSREAVGVSGIEAVVLGEVTGWGAKSWGVSLLLMARDLLESLRSRWDAVRVDREASSRAVASRSRLRHASALFVSHLPVCHALRTRLGVGVGGATSRVQSLIQSQSSGDQAKLGFSEQADWFLLEAIG